jgi:hypothetical protein
MSPNSEKAPPPYSWNHIICIIAFCLPSARYSFIYNYFLPWQKAKRHQTLHRFGDYRLYDLINMVIRKILAILINY